MKKLFLIFISFSFLSIACQNKPVETKIPIDTIRIYNAINLIDSIKQIDSRIKVAFTIYDSIINQNFLDSLEQDYYDSQDPPEDPRN